MDVRRRGLGELLDLTCVPLDRSFFDLGGDSLQLLELHHRLRNRCADLEAVELFRFPFEEMIQRTADKHNELLVFACEMPRFRSTPDTLDARGQESVPPGTVYTTRKIGEQTCRAFAVSIETIRTLRDLGYRGIIAPYAVALQNAVANTVVGFTQRQETFVGPVPPVPAVPPDCDDSSALGVPAHRLLFAYGALSLVGWYHRPRVAETWHRTPMVPAGENRSPAAPGERTSHSRAR